MTKNVIEFYGATRAYGAFSNFSKHPVFYKGVKWPTSEHAFQGMKFEGTEHFEAVRRTGTPAAAKKMGGNRTLPLRKDWETIKDKLMVEICYAKFTQHNDLKKMILSTGDAKLVEHTRNDRYWGDGGDGSGRNQLGKCLMEVRDMILKAESIEDNSDRGDETDDANDAEDAEDDTNVEETGVLHVKSGDLLTATEQYIAHQCNCTSTYAKGLSSAVFKKFPDANIYKASVKRTPGTIITRGKVINILGQVGPGKPKRPPNIDSYDMRVQNFKKGLKAIADLKPKSVAFPFLIGCGLAGGKWSDYEAALQNFAKKIHPARVVLYKLGK